MEFGPALTEAQISYRKVGNDLVIGVNEGQTNEGSIKVQGWFRTTGSIGQIATIEFADGTLRTNDEVSALAQQ